MAQETISRYATIEKEVGETPLVAAERLRAQLGLSAQVPLAYAGRLDPMASGKLLILIGNECKHQEKYHAFDKEYQFSVLFGVHSDTADVLGLAETCAVPDMLDSTLLKRAARTFVGNITLPYPHFSSKTVQGKPLHTWTLEGRLNEIEIPVKESQIYSLSLDHIETIQSSALFKNIHGKMDSIPPVTETSKALGRDFRRTEIHARWNEIEKSAHGAPYTIAHFTCIASSGTYMRSLAEMIAREIGSCGLAYSIHRTKIGAYQPITSRWGFWKKQF